MPLGKKPELSSTKQNAVMAKLDTKFVGVAGEYDVATGLTLRGYIAAITLRNSRGVEIVASLPDGSKSISIQVKTSNGNQRKWLLNKKA